MLKRIFDFVVSSMSLILLFPVLIIVGILIRIKLGSPILFRQTRPGKDTKPFSMIKFRTMTNNCDNQGALLSDSDRLTPFGRFLRSSSLDELPELWNVFLGHMSLVGPRPLLTRYLPFYTDAEKVRFNVRPGITGWAQVNGRNLASWNTRLSLDIWYVSNQSFLLDLKIIFITLVKVFKTDGVVADPSTLMKNLDEERSTAG